MERYHLSNRYCMVFIGRLPAAFILRLSQSKALPVRAGGVFCVVVSHGLAQI